MANNKVESPYNRLGRKENEPVAIVGIGCRFPEANGPMEFWRLLQDGVDPIKDVPKDRFDIDALFDPRPGIPGKLASRKGGFLNDVDKFDAAFFAVSPREAMLMDPQQRLALEVAWEAMEDAGQPVDKLIGSRTGVYIGVCIGDYETVMYRDLSELNIYSAVGNFRCAVPGRISYALGLKGPSISIDTGCASSLVAVHLAFQSIQNGECEMALAGGVNLIITPYTSIAFSRSGMLAPDGRCKTFDAGADGFVRSEGVAVVVLKPLSRALADGDPIYATILGAAVNDDGRGNGLFFSPSVEGHQAVLKDAYRSAGVSPADIQYVETHGTGTKIGDPTEAEALGAFFSKGRPADRPLVLGSVKSNIGHTESAAGIAGLIKAALSLKRRQIPPNLHIGELNPEIPWDELHLTVQRALGAWPVRQGEVARAGVSSLGISGTNAHVVLEEPPQILITPNNDEVSVDRDQVLALSARSPEALKQMARNWQSFLLSEAASDINLYDICYTAGVRRSSNKYRLATVGASKEAHAAQLEAFLREELGYGAPDGEIAPGEIRKIAFVFSGHGAQWLGMGRRLMKQEPAFRAIIEECDRLMAQYVDWSLLDELRAEETHFRSNGNDVIQPMLFAIQAGQVGLWRSWGVEPDAVIGHSMGEVAAAYAAGSLNLDEACRMICVRSKLLNRLRGQGSMAIVELTIEQSRDLLAGYEDRVAIAASNSPSATALSGETVALKEIAATLEGRDIYCRFIRADGAGHSPQVEPLSAELASAMCDLKPRPGIVPIYSCVTGEVIEGGSLDAAYWAANMRKTVLFSVAVDKMRRDGFNLFLEVAPSPILQASVRQVFQHAGAGCDVIASMRRDEDDSSVALGALGSLYALGHPVDWSRLYARKGRCVRLPSYPWRKERFWFESDGVSHGQFEWRSFSSASDPSTHPLLGYHIESSVHPGVRLWETDLSLSRLPYLGDHRLQNKALLPATAYLEIAQAGAAEIFGDRPYLIEDVEFKNALFLPEDGSQKAQLAVSPEGPDIFSFKYCSRQEGAGQKSVWALNAAGKIRSAETTSPGSAELPLPRDVQMRCSDTISGAEFYGEMLKRNVQYGPGFQGVTEMWRRDGEAVARVNIPDTIASQASRYKIHPAILDACLHAVMATLPEGGKDFAYMPVALRRMMVYAPLPLELWSYALLDTDSNEDTQTIGCDVSLLDGEGRLLARLEGLRLRRIVVGLSNSDAIDDWMYEIRWESKDAPQAHIENRNLAGTWIIFADAQGFGRRLSELLISSGQTYIMVSSGASYLSKGPTEFEIKPSCPEDFQRLFKDLARRPVCRGVVYLWGLDSSLDSLDAEPDLGCGGALHLIQAMAPADWSERPCLRLVTNNAQSVEGEAASLAIAQSPMWGLGRVITRERPELRCKLIDIGAEDVERGAGQLFEELFREDEDNEVALRGGARYVSRLARSPRRLRQETASARKKLVSLDGRHALRLDASTPGILDNLRLREISRQDPKPGEVEIEVYAAGLNFRDVLITLDMLRLPDGTSMDLGFECAGRISAIGDGVEGFNVGDAVIAVSFSSFKSFVVTDARMVVPKPPELSFEKAAAIPVAFLTAYYAICEQGRLRKGERILIHAAAGGVGLAAVQLARRIGGEIFATAGSDEKREFLRSLGIKHVFNSRSLEFAGEIMRVTGGEGVDVVLNSLAGEFIPKSMSLLKPQGRFLEIGAADILQNTRLEMGLLWGNKSFFAIELYAPFQQCPSICGAMLREIMSGIGDGSLSPLPTRVYPISDAAEAFHFMAQAKHIGKIAFSWRESQAWVESEEPEEKLFHSDATYLITGGLGGLGLAIAKWMVEKGARHLALASRGAPSAEAEKRLEELRESGTEVLSKRADISKREQVESLIGDIKRTMPPLRGVMHLAAILRDGVLTQLDLESFKSVMGPKVVGAWNLHTLTLDEPLDFFVLFSSAASLLGSPGQANYVAANAFLDAFAHYRKAQGLPALSVNWGVWAGAGGVASPEHRKLLAERGLDAITLEQGLTALEKFMRQGTTQIAFMNLDAGRWSRSFATGSKEMLLSYLIGEQDKTREGADKGVSLRESLMAEPQERRRRAMLESVLKEHLAKVLRISSDQVRSSAPLSHQGLDSLMSIELRNRLEAQFGITLSATLVWKYPTVTSLASHLAEKMNVPINIDEQSSPATSDKEPEQDIVLAQLQQLAESDLGAKLAARLQSLEET